MSWQRRDPDAFTFESTGGNGGGGLTNLGLLDRESTAVTFAGGWTRIWSGTLVSEFRGGYSTDTRNRRSRYTAGSLASQFGLEVPPLAAEAPGFSSFLFSGTNRPSDLRDQRQNTFRDLDQSSSSISSSSTWLKGRHSIKFGGIYTRNFAKDGYSTGANESKGAYAFSGFATGNAFADLLLGLPNEVREQRNTRGDLPMDTFSNDWAIYAQDDVKLNPRSRTSCCFLLRTRSSASSWTRTTSMRTSSQLTAAITSCRAPRSAHCCRRAPSGWAARSRRISSMSAAG